MTVVLNFYDFNQFYIKLKRDLRGPNEPSYRIDEYDRLLSDAGIRQVRPSPVRDPNQLSTFHIPDDLYVRIMMGFNK